MASAAERSASAAQILQDLRAFNSLGSVLHIGAHPDDENTQLITYLSRARGYRTAYLSLTRGDGGQNEIGPDFDEKLGVARTQELLAARRIDGGKQFFTRAIDFGYSKSPEETLRIWDKQEVLGDVVRIIRTFRPDVIVTRFPIPPGSGGHGHHTASAMLAVEAFRLAADPNAYPEQLREGLSAWSPRRVLWNVFQFGGNRYNGPLKGPTIELDIGGKDPVTGEEFASIASRSIGMHKTQGVSRRGPDGPNVQALMLLAGDEPTEDFMAGVDTSWNRIAGGADIGRMAQEVIDKFNPDNPAASVPALLKLRGAVRALAGRDRDPVIEDKLVELDHIIRNCLGLQVTTTATIAEVVPGEAFEVRAEVNLQADVVPVTLQSIATPGATSKLDRALRAGVEAAESLRYTVPPDAAVTQPYWLREDAAGGMARVADESLIGLPENPPALPVRYRFTVGTEELEVVDEPVFVPRPGETARSRRVDIIPPVSLRFGSNVSVFTPATAREVIVEVTAARRGASGSVRLELPAGWRATPEQQQFRLSADGEKARLNFLVTAPPEPAVGRMTAVAEVNGKRYAHQRTEIDYPHIPLQLLQPPSRARLVSTDVAMKSKNVGYLPGAGDATKEALEQLGAAVTILSGSDLTAEALGKFDAVVVGVRAFNERTDLAANLPGLFAYVENGGTVIVQYNRPNGLVTQQLGPYKLAINGPAPRLRVTDEKSPVSFLAPEHPLLNSPNQITPADFEGWVQERGLYFPSSWDEEKYQPILALNDPGEEPLKSSVLVAQHGNGHFVYTGLAFFRQLPAGVPGAYRLFANLVSLGK